MLLTMKISAIVRGLLFSISLFLGLNSGLGQAPTQKNYLGFNATGLINKGLGSYLPNTFELVYLRNIKSRGALRISTGYEQNNRHRKLEAYRQSGFNVKAQINLYDPSRNSFLFTGLLFGHQKNEYNVVFEGNRFNDLIVPLKGNSTYQGIFLGTGFNVDLGKDWLLESLLFLSFTSIHNPDNLIRYYHLAGAGQRYKNGDTEFNTFLRAQINLLIPL